MYGEIDGVEREGFETHLAECVTCTDDFAAISNARFSVFEWRKEEFDRLATPNIVIPELSKSAVNTTADSGWFAGLATLLAFARTPIVAAAALLVCLGLGFIALSYFRITEELIATNTEVTVPALSNAEENKKQFDDSTSEVIPPDSVDPIVPIKTSASKKRAPSHEPIRTNEIRRAVSNTPKRLSSPQRASKPVLNDFNDETDKSLRLADLFDEVGG